MPHNIKLGKIIRQGTTRGITWEVRQGPFSYCGYAIIPENHPWRKGGQQQYLEDILPIGARPTVHGGLTYGPDPEGRIGFDCHQTTDYDPDINPNGHEWSASETEYEAQYLARQISRAA